MLLSPKNVSLLKYSFFSINFDLIVVGEVLGYDLYVNASGISGRERYVKIFKSQNILELRDLEIFRSKYPQLYVSEAQRGKFTRSLVKHSPIPDVAKAEILKDSALKYLHNIFDSGKEFNTALLSDTINGCREIVESMVDVFDKHDLKSIQGLIGSLSFHDFYTYDHSINVSMYCIAILKEIDPNISKQDLMHIGLGGLLHDLGKVKISTDILNNPGKLSPEEYGQIKLHPTYGIDLLLSGQCETPPDIDLQVIARVIHEHHENWNGTGYPHKLKEEEISYFARICTIADFFDAITTKRSYNEVMAIEHAVGVMEKTAGIKIDPEIFKVFTSKVKKIVMSQKVDVKLADSFDPTLPYEKLPLEKVKVEEEKKDFGKIKIQGDLGLKNSKKAS